MFIWVALGMCVTIIRQAPQYNDGGKARSWAHRRPGTQGLTEHVIAVIMRDVLSALAYMHKSGIIHRDLKVCLYALEYCRNMPQFADTTTVVQHASVQKQTFRTNVGHLIVPNR